MIQPSTDPLASFNERFAARYRRFAEADAAYAKAIDECRWMERKATFWCAFAFFSTCAWQVWADTLTAGTVVLVMFLAIVARGVEHLRIRRWVDKRLAELEVKFPREAQR